MLQVMNRHSPAGSAVANLATTVNDSTSFFGGEVIEVNVLASAL